MSLIIGVKPVRGDLLSDKRSGFHPQPHRILYTHMGQMIPVSHSIVVFLGIFPCIVKYIVKKQDCRV